MKNDEPRWEDTRHYVERHAIDGFLSLPWLGYGAGVFARDLDLIGFAFAAWALAVAIWTPWIVFRVRMGRPTGDTPRAAAVLGLGLLPWLLVIPLFDVLSAWPGGLIGFPLFFLWGAGAMAMAAFQWPPLRSARQRAAILVAGGLAYALVAAAFGLFLVADLSRGGAFASVVLLPLAGAAGLAAIFLLIAATRPYAPHRF